MGFSFSCIGPFLAVFFFLRRLKLVVGTYIQLQHHKHVLYIL